MRSATFSAQLAEPVYVGEQLALPYGTTIRGIIAHVERAGRVEDHAELNPKFESIELPNGEVYPITATLARILSRREKETVESGEGTLEGEGSLGRDAATVGTGAGIGSIVGGITGGKRAAVGLAGVLATRGRDVELRRGTELEIMLDRPLEFPPYR